jgi:hypothetical protein
MLRFEFATDEVLTHDLVIWYLLFQSLGYFLTLKPGNRRTRDQRVCFYLELPSLMGEDCAHETNV